MGINDDLKEVYTFAKAAELYGLANGSTLRKAVQDGRFLEGEIEKLGRDWVVTKAAMERLYGDRMKNKSIADRVKEATNKAANKAANEKTKKDVMWER